MSLGWKKKGEKAVVKIKNVTYALECISKTLYTGKNIYGGI